MTTQTSAFPQALLRRVSVQAPYLALRNLEVLGAGWVAAEAPVEYPLGREVGPMSAAEAGRHLALVGSLAAASLQADDRQHYYLARRASLRRKHPGGGAGTGPLRVVARALLSRRSASASTVLKLASGRPVLELDVEYSVLSAKSFTRIFQSRASAASSGDSRAAVPRLSRSDVRVVAGGHASASFQVDAADCSGHFEGFPAMPVAKLSHGFGLVAGELVADLAASEDSCEARYRIDRCTLSADLLPFAGDSLHLGMSYVGRRRSAERICGTATDQDGQAVDRFEADFVSLGARSVRELERLQRAV